jgi:hypothetical protein
VTTRSNVFAVWMTVGFFAVRDATTYPPKLGAEIGLAQNQNIRHKVFFIVDRTNLTIGQNLAQITSAVTLDPTKPVPPVPPLQPVSVSALQGTTTPNAPSVPITWQIQVGSTLVVDTGVNQETVVVTSVDTTNTKITANFVRSHPANTPITIPGNPGPQPLFDPRNPQYSAVVPFYAILQ